MNYIKFYDQLFAPLQAFLGPIDRDTIVSIIGFDMGGPLNFCTLGLNDRLPCITYVSCELAVRVDQVPSGFGRFELLATCDDEAWVRSIVTEIGRMTLEVSFGHGDTLDIGPWIGADAPLQGVVFEEASRTRVGDEGFGILRVIGISRPELEFAQENGMPSLVEVLKEAGMYPNTFVNRTSVL